MIRATLTAVFSAFFLTAVPSSASAADPNSTYQQLNLFGDVFELVRSRYVNEVNEQRLINAAVNSMLTSLDPHSSFMDSETYAAMQERTSGEFGGLGIEVRMEEGFVRVVRPMEDTPAFRAGVKAGDKITALDGQDVTGMTLADAVDIMRGPVNSNIELTIVREGVEEPMMITVTRAVIRLPSVRYRAEGNAAYIQITSFSSQTESGIIRGMAELREQLGDNFEGVILDLRGNPGGLLEQSVAATEAFLDRGEVVSTRHVTRLGCSALPPAEAT
jgi:carboxyl-terminal processing protease